MTLKGVSVTFLDADQGVSWLVNLYLLLKYLFNANSHVNLIFPQVSCFLP